MWQAISCSRSGHGGWTPGWEFYMCSIHGFSTKDLENGLACWNFKIGKIAKLDMCRWQNAKLLAFPAHFRAKLSLWLCFTSLNYQLYLSVRSVYLYSSLDYSSCDVHSSCIQIHWITIASHTSLLSTASSNHPVKPNLNSLMFKIDASNLHTDGRHALPCCKGSQASNSMESGANPTGFSALDDVHKIDAFPDSLADVL